MVKVNLILLILVVSIYSIQGLLRPKRAGKRSRKYYNKNAIKAHINKQRMEKVHQHSININKYDDDDDDEDIDDEDITTATDKMWASCDERYFEQNLDHFGSGIGPENESGEKVTTFNQRYYLCGKNLYNWKPNSPVFFYFGNEADVTAYIDYTGFMWEQAENFNALLVFAEHRYYGESLPYTKEEIIDSTAKLKYCTTDQALEDYAVLIDYLKKNTFGYGDEYNDASSSGSSIIGFGGSYGGMLAAYFRMKYPTYVDGVISGSSPIWGIFGLIPEADPYAFAAMETHDASTDVGVDNELCQINIKQGWNDILQLAETKFGRSKIKNVFNLCETPKNAALASEVLEVVEESIAYMAMSSYPYPSNYISGAVLGTTSGSLPAYPLRYSCNNYLTKEFDSSLRRVEAIGKFNDVFWNSDGLNQCIDMDTLWDTYNSYIWDYLYCRSLLMPSGSKGGDNDMLWDSEWSVQDTISWCNEQYDINVDIKGPASRKYGGRNIYKSMSNIVFSNGDMDPWMPGGILSRQSESLINILIENAGHHLDLMFSNSNDPQSLIQARIIEVENIEKWIKQSNNDWNMGMCDIENAYIDLSDTKNPWISAMNMLL